MAKKKKAAPKAKKRVVKTACSTATKSTKPDCLSLHNKLKKAGLRLPHGYVIVKRKK